ncbi:SDR family NAD(P)-dependent oxidoreductase [Aliikangiella coralliicola]|uniref:SDR family NAD(P)-dependent oxidoreductase n=1 Tax=Aliikangiella coralliicola TaxID=2592383 RepID=A0A545U942_9GAMM|nr:SDR family NAD(P)-dependent oxidoreductase [Aliikangiella coralliicola]TQV86000.1 SDR family NAD(P)-dependent oxidoreductase [Aliikangiella coralliicola]
MTNAASQSTAKDYPVGVFNSVFTGNEAFLADHIIQGKKILPGMAYLEISRAAVAASVSLSDKHMIVLSDSIFVNALVVTKKCSLEVKVYPGAAGEFGVEVSTELGVHFQSKAQIIERPEQPYLDLDTLNQDCAASGPTKQQFYTGFKNREVNLGPSHRGVELIKLGDGCALVKLSIPGSSSRGMAMDPGMLDSVIQGGVALSSNEEANVVPFAVMKTQVFAPLVDEMYVHVVKTEEGLDYTVSDESGEIKVIINGFLTREIDLNAQQDQLVFYKPEWNTSSDEKDKFASEEHSQNVTVISDSTDYDNLVKSVFDVSQKLINDKTEGHVIEVHIPADKPEWQGIIAQLKTVSLEYPKISYRMKVGDQLKTLTYSTQKLPGTTTYNWPDSKTVLITGGLGGLGLIFAQDIAKNSQGNHLILVGRSELDSSSRASIQQLEDLGAKVDYVRCDISKDKDVAAVISKYPDISGVIHGSGIIRDNFIHKKSKDEIAPVLAPKVKGLANLDEATASYKLDFFIALSSIAGTLGNAGQIDYAAANGFMDAYIQERARQVESGQRQGKSISINWPLWESGGMKIDEATTQNLLQVYKIKPLPTEEGVTALKQIIASEHQQLVVVYGQKKSIATLFESKPSESNKNEKTQLQKQQQKNGEEDESGIETSKLSKEILQEVRLQTAEHLKLRPNQLDDTADWAVFGFDSILLSSFVNRFNTHFDLNLMPTVMFEATNMELFSQYLANKHGDEMAKKLALNGNKKPADKRAKSSRKMPDPGKQKESSSQQPDPLKISAFAQGFKKSYKSSIRYSDKDIAIVGMSCRIAGATNPDEFWEMLDQGKDMISEIPSDRWDWRDYPGVSKWGSFIDDVDKFDSLFFGISPAEAMYMNPEQRLMMQYVWECVENAGCGGDDIKGNSTGLFIGCGPSGYSSLLHGLPIEAYSATGTVSSVGPNRISYLMDWHGPSNPIDTACSSALVALHRAVEVIRSGQCEQAIAGGVNLLLAPDGYISFAKSGMLCEDGRCKTFSDKANGYVRGEGIGMLMLKPLKAAIRDNNTIYALVKGSAENHGGRTNSLTAPNPKSQAAVIKQAVKDAGIDFSRVSYIECHGTGTELGDPVEINGLKSVAAELLDGEQNGEQTCKLGSIKSNIGHLEYGAGVVGLIKVILQMRHKKIAKSLHCENLNPYIDLSGTPFEIAQTESDWEVPEGLARTAGVSSFGFGGVNAHVILEEFEQPIVDVDGEESEGENQSQLLVISAKNEDSLIDYVAQFPSYIENLRDEHATLKNVAYTLQTGRAEMQERLVFVADSFDEWTEQLNSFLQEKGKIYNRKIYRGSVKLSAADNLEIGDTQAGKDYIKQLIATNESEKLAELWVKGTQIDWQSLHG